MTVEFIGNYCGTVTFSFETYDNGSGSGSGGSSGGSSDDSSSGGSSSGGTSSSCYPCKNHRRN
ncbi:MAG: hypothetical protein LUG95_01320 [Clostridiales bacterium]|nr:hypothetical protein [Clostridiales bacterium]